MKEEMKNLMTLTVDKRFFSIFKTMLCCCLKCRKNTERKNPMTVKKKKKKENQCFYKNVQYVIIKKIYQRARSY